jgi:hypothetical protein
MLHLLTLFIDIDNRFASTIVRELCFLYFFMEHQIGTIELIILIQGRKFWFFKMT